MTGFSDMIEMDLTQTSHIYKKVFFFAMYFHRKEILAYCNYPLCGYLIKVNNKGTF